MSQLDVIKVLSDKDPLEIIPVVFDFTNVVAAIDSVVSIGVTVYKGTDASASSMPLNSAVIDGTTVVQLIRNGVSGVSYKLRADILVGQQRYALSAILPVRTQ